MNKILSSEALEKSLNLLAMVLERADAYIASLVVCSGSSLIATNLVLRTTKDVDILALYDDAKGIHSAEPLPQALLNAAEVVADEMGLIENWLNNGPRMLVNDKLPNKGLPEGFENRLIKKKYGERLCIYFVARLDQIHFKLFAAADKGGPSYHLDDLLALDPSVSELEAAAKWAMLQDPSSGFKDTLRAMFKVIGYDSLLERI